uniref:hypothetical protein n=1 Tax=Agrobacterium sp. CFBP2214 TaxID=3040274 RepID=UPI0025501763
MQYERIKKLELAARRDEIEREMERYEIFIAGPYIDKAKDRSDSDNSDLPLNFHPAATRAPAVLN